MIVETAPVNVNLEAPKPKVRRGKLKVVTSLRDLRTCVERWRCTHKSIGFVPTMGSLHEGHAALIRAARAACDRVVVSIFVNPLQFGPQEDFNTYPRDLKKDTRLCRTEKVDLLFCPSAEEMVPEGFKTQVVVDERLTETLCGASRPGHFAGVATIVTKLLSLVRPHQAYFGQKDYQQTLVVRRLVEDLNLGCEVVVLATVRDADGLAKSSRNAFLSAEERRAAPAIYQALKLAESMLQVGERNPQAVAEAISKRLRSEAAITVEYIATKAADTLSDLKILSGRVLVAVAARVGKTRLIDNVIVDVPSGS